MGKEGRGDDTKSVDNILDSGRVLPSVLNVDYVYEALAHPRRRYLCYTLLENTEWSLETLATKIAAFENNISDSSVTVYQQQQVYISLYHAHIPNLVENRIISFDPTTETITIAQNATQVLNALERIGASSDATQEQHARSEKNDRK